MGGNAGEIEIGSERELYKYIINHQAGTTKKTSTRIILVQMMMYNVFRLLIGVPDYSSGSYRKKQKLIGSIVIISQRGRGVSVNHRLTWKTYYTPGPRG